MFQKEVGESTLKTIKNNKLCLEDSIIKMLEREDFNLKLDYAKQFINMLNYIKHYDC